MAKQPVLGIDLGTTNTVVAKWNEENGVPSLIGFPEICREPLEGSQGIEVQFTIPSALYLETKSNWKSRIGRIPFFEKNFFLGSRAKIGQLALEADNMAYHSQFITNFKPVLLRGASKIMTKIGSRIVSARESTKEFFRELLRSIKIRTGTRPRSLALSVPVDSYETYRAQLLTIGKELGVKEIHLVDEPVAAAMGYGLKLEESQNVLVADFGGGTLDLALVKISEKTRETGRCEVISKVGAPIGGNTVDQWIAQYFAEELGFDTTLLGKNSDADWWFRIITHESRRIKEALFFKKEETFYLTAPEEVLSFEKRLYAQNQKIQGSAQWSREGLENLLEKEGLYKILKELTDQLLVEAKMDEEVVDYVLMVGGSNLLPGIFPHFEKRFGRSKVQAWQPFNAVAYGACAFGNRSFQQSDFIVHSYAIETRNRKTTEKEYKIIVPRGTRYPTQRDFWRRQFIPTCSTGEPETLFKLIICELGIPKGKDQEFFWDENGELHVLAEGEEAKPLVVPLNQDDPALGVLSPPHQPNDRNPRLQIGFYINQERWLCTDVTDLKTGKKLFWDKPVIRLI